MERLFSVTVYVFNREGTECLFVDHKKLKKWLPPGGKVDPNELPDDAAIRECLEETGLTITLIGERAPVTGGLIRPYGMQCNSIIPAVRDHIDFIYLAVASRHDAITLSQTEAAGIAWFPIDTVLDTNFNTFDGVKTWIKRLANELQNS